MTNRRSTERVAAIPLNGCAKNRFSVVAAALIAATILSGCVNRQSASVTPGFELKQLKEFHVVKFAPDGRGINNVIRDRLDSLGYTASTSADTKPPRKVDAIVTYRDRWRWDIAMYLLKLTITFSNPDTKAAMAVGSSYHTSLTRKSTDEMVDEVLTNIFAKIKTSN